jgi:hypothetical protein
MQKSCVWLVRLLCKLSNIGPRIQPFWDKVQCVPRVIAFVLFSSCFRFLFCFLLFIFIYFSCLFCLYSFWIVAANTVCLPYPYP